MFVEQRCWALGICWQARQVWALPSWSKYSNEGDRPKKRLMTAIVYIKNKSLLSEVEVGSVLPWGQLVTGRGKGGGVLFWDALECREHSAS